MPFKMKDNKANYLFKKNNLPNQVVVSGTFGEDDHIIMP